MRHAPVRLPCVIPRLAALLCSAAVLACSSEDALPTSASPAPLDARPAAALEFGPATPVPVPADCPETVPAHVNARGVIVGFTGGPCFGDPNAQAFRLYPDGTFDSLPEPYGQPVSPIVIGPHDEVYAIVQNPDPNGGQLVAVIDAAGRLTWLPLPADGRSYGVSGHPNGRGTFVIYGGAPNGTVEFFLWNGRGRFEPLPMPPDGQLFQANGLNDRDEVVGTMYTGDRQYAATWSRRDGYTVLPLPSSALYGSTGDLIDNHGRVYGRTQVVKDSSCPDWSTGTTAPTVWNGRDTVRVLANVPVRCLTAVYWQAATDGGLAVGTLWGDPLSPSILTTFAFLATSDGRLALAPCTDCTAAGIDRHEVVVGKMPTDDRSAYRTVTWPVNTKP